MEDTLRLMVREHGFEAIFTSLKAIVSAEYERAKRDFEFLESVMPKPTTSAAADPEVKTVEIVAASADPDVKTVEIEAPPPTRRVFKKPQHKA